MNQRRRKCRDEQDRSGYDRQYRTNAREWAEFVMQDTPAGQSSEEARPASTLQGTYAQYRQVRKIDSRIITIQRLPATEQFPMAAVYAPPYGGGGQVPPMGPPYGGGMGQPLYPPVKTKSKNGWKVWVALLCIVCLCASVIGGVDHHQQSVAESCSQRGRR